MKTVTKVGRALVMATATLGGGTFAAAQDAPITLEVYNPGSEAIFPVSSILVAGEEEAILVDAQFSTVHAQDLVELVEASGKNLTTIYISHSDPDYYFGLQTLVEAFPEAEVLATPYTIEYIEATKDDKLGVWGPQLGEGAPDSIIVPSPLEGDTLTLEGHELKIIGLDGPAPARTVIWIPEIEAVIGGIPVIAGDHVWMADTQTPESRANWLAMLEEIKALEPVTVIPGHFAPDSALDISAVDFTAEYIVAFENAAAQAENSEELIAEMTRLYPDLAGLEGLELSAKVILGEMEW